MRFPGKSFPDPRLEVHLSIEAGQVVAQGKQFLLHYEDPMAMNSASNPTEVRPKVQDLDLHPSDLRPESPAHSHLVVRLQLQSSEIPVPMRIL